MGQLVRSLVVMRNESSASRFEEHKLLVVPPDAVLHTLLGGASTSVEIKPLEGNAPNPLQVGLPNKMERFANQI